MVRDRTSLTYIIVYFHNHYCCSSIVPNSQILYHMCVCIRKTSLVLSVISGIHWHLRAYLPTTDWGGGFYHTFISDFLQDMPLGWPQARLMKVNSVFPNNPRNASKTHFNFPCEICQQVLLHPPISILPDYFYLNKQYLISWSLLFCLDLLLQ